MRASHDSRETFARVSHDVRANFDQFYLSQFKLVSHQPCGSCAPICDDNFLGFVRQPQGVVYYTARLPYEIQGRKAAATNFRHVHFFFAICLRFLRDVRQPQDTQGCRKTAARHVRCSYD